MNSLIPRGIAPREQVIGMIEAGHILSLAGTEATLARLPKGSWVGGTATEFLADGVLVPAGDSLCYADLTGIATGVKVRHFRLGELSQISAHYPTHGFALIIAPGNSGYLPYMNEILLTDDRIYGAPLIGWVAGTGAYDEDMSAAKSFAGTPVGRDDAAAILFVTLRDDLFAHMRIVNPYSPRKGPGIQFPTLSSTQTDCLADGEPRNFAEYLASLKADYGLPLLADWDGAQVNVSILTANAATGETRFLMPVCPHLIYHLAKDEPGMEDAFLQAANQMETGRIAALSICAASVLHAHHGKLPHMTAPVSLGQIAYTVLNQALTCISIEPFGFEDE